MSPLPLQGSAAKGTRNGGGASAACYNKYNNIIINKFIITFASPSDGLAGGQRQSGIALITAILVVALASIAAAAILTSANIAIHRAATLQDSEKAWWYADGVEAWTKTILQRDATDNQTDSFKDIWAKPVDYLPVDEGFVRGRIEDLQGRFNLNNLGDPDPAHFKQYTEQFERLLQNIEGADPFLAKPLASAIHDWIDRDTEPTGFDGAEDSEYLGHNPPYRAPNKYMESVSEVLAVKGMTKDLYYKLTHCGSTKAGPVSCITALPALRTAINVNTAPEPVLRSLVRQPTPALDAFIKDRDSKPLDKNDDIFQLPPTGLGLSAVDVPDRTAVTTRSNYFLLRSETFIGSGRVALYSFFLRPDQGAPIVLGRSTDTE